MRVRLTIHAEERLRRYALDRTWVEAAVHEPDWVVADPFQPGITRSFKAIAARDNRILRVAHRPDGPDVLVLSAFFDRGARQ